MAVDISGEGPAVLFVHGFPFDRTMWHNQLSDLAGFASVAPDLRGMGRSTFLDPTAAAGSYTMAAYADDLGYLMDALELSTAVLCGLSMGGYVAFECLRRWPERVSALILMDTKAEADDADVKRVRTKAMEAVRRGGTEAIVDAMLPKLFSPLTLADRPDLVERTRSMMCDAPSPGVVGALGAMRDRADSTAVLAQLDMPTLVLVGEDDQLTPPSMARLMASGIQGGQYREVGRAGHLLPLEQPEATTAIIATFLHAALKPGQQGRRRGVGEGQ